MPPTHEVFNQPPPLVDYNLFTTDAALGEAVERECAAWAVLQLREFGKILGTADVIRWGFQANENPPVLETHDRFGHRRDEVEFHPAWHELLRLAIAHGLHSQPWAEPRSGAHVARAAMMMLAGQNESGHMCPVSMTYSSVPVIRSEPELAAAWSPGVLSLRYDSAFRPAAQKTGLLIGMGMTEKQGGSDVRANTTRAEQLSGGEYQITGHKWFCSAPMSDAFLVLAQAPGGLTCFLLPRWTPDGAQNAFRIQRLKRKLGNRSNASSEVEFENAWAHRIGEEGRGIATIMEMVQHTRLDCCIGSTAIMRRALVEALHHARHRTVFGRLLSEQPLMLRVLADLAIDSEAATLMTMRVARAFDSRSNARERAFARLATAVAKYWICKRAPAFAAEALECLGGSGYVEESILPRLYREAPVNSIWEGSGNVICLDVLRATRKEPESVDAFFEELALAKRADRRFDRALDDAQKILADRPDQADARTVTALLAALLQTSLALRFSPGAVAGAMCRRLGHDGDAPSTEECSSIAARAWPA